MGNYDLVQALLDQFAPQPKPITVESTPKKPKPKGKPRAKNSPKTRKPKGSDQAVTPLKFHEAG